MSLIVRGIQNLEMLKNWWCREKGIWRKYDYTLAAYKNNKTKTAVILIIKESFSLS